MEMLILKLLLIPLATWRLYRLFATDTGPKQILRKLRIKLGVQYKSKTNTWWDEGSKQYKYSIEPDYDHWTTPDGSLAEGITCCWCASLWWGALLTLLLLLASDWLFLLATVPLNAGAACLFFENKIYSSK